jgi:hypothetical protein
VKLSRSFCGYPVYDLCGAPCSLFLLSDKERKGSLLTLHLIP